MIIFLDIDGVLNNEMENIKINETCITHLVNALQTAHETNISIVITSTWRLIYSKLKLKSLLGNALSEYIIGCTPVINDENKQGVRSREIRRYLEQTNTQTPWLAIDDNLSLYEIKDHEKILNTDASTGFSSHNKTTLINWLITTSV